MSVHTTEMYIGTPDTIKCEYCGKRVSKWIDIVPGGKLCVNCAQRTMRVLFQDLIQFHNPGTSISLIDIMYHGDTRKEPGGELYPWGKQRDEVGTNVR